MTDSNLHPSVPEGTATHYALWRVERGWTWKQLAAHLEQYTDNEHLAAWAGGNHHNDPSAVQAATAAAEASAGITGEPAPKVETAVDVPPRERAVPPPKGR